MNLSKKSSRIKVFLVLLLVAGFALNFGLKYAYIGSSYNAKMVCSCMFVSGRNLESIKAEDLYAVPYSTLLVDKEKQTVTADIYGFAKATAIFRKGLGCTLVNELSEEKIRNQPSLEIPKDTVKESLSLVANFPSEINKNALNQAINEAFEEKNAKNIIRTRAVIVLYKGKLLAEKYASTITAETPLIGWSMTKSVTNAMIGLLVKDGKIDIYKPAPITEWQNDNRKKITTDQLLRMSSGLSFEENYAKPSDATQMLFRKKGAGAFAINSNEGSEPNKVWSYSSGTTNILQEIIRRQFTNVASYQAFPHLRLFQKIGMKSAIIEPDASGTFVGSSFMFATARDWAKFGQLYLQDGNWNGEQILPAGWAKYSSTETPNSNGEYAAQFWLNHQDKTFPQDAFMALGFEGQSVTIIPSKQLVIVRLGCTPNEDNFNRSAFIKKVVAAVN